MTTKNFEPIKGFRDYDGKEAEKKAVIKEIIRQAFERYGFGPAETPVIESEEFVKGDNANDEAVSDIYKLKDKGDRKLALRYEFTFQLKRLMNNKKLPFKRYQIGELFRDEPVGPNRFRQFTQCDADVVGSTMKDEAEIFAMAKAIFDSLKIDFVIYFNNRKLLNEILDELGIKNKSEVIKEIDKLDKLPEKEVLANLKKFGAEEVLKIAKKSEDFFKKYKAYEEIEELQKLCRVYGVEVKFSPTLARGLSYYNGTVFEIKTKKMCETIVAGGSYEFAPLPTGMTKGLGVPQGGASIPEGHKTSSPSRSERRPQNLGGNVQCTGISFGLERLCAVANLIVDLEKYLIVSLGQDKTAIKLAQKLRKQGKIVGMYYGKPSRAMEYANSYSFKKVIFVGAREVKERKFKVKIMKTGKESLLNIK